jgi:hypothetical protein
VSAIKAAKYLEELQANIYDNDAIAKAYIDSERSKGRNIKENKLFEKSKEEYTKQYQNAFDVMPTKYETPNNYLILLGLLKDIEKSAIQLSMEIPQLPIMGTLNSGRVNAMAIAVPNSDEYIIVFEFQVFMFALLFCKAIALAIPDLGEKDGMWHFSLNMQDIEKEINNNKNAIQRFSEVLSAYLLFGVPGKAPPYSPKHTVSLLANILYTSMELFIMGHEYGHIQRNHFTQSSRMSIKIGQKDVQELRPEWKKEIEADIIGLQLSTHAMLGKGYPLDLCISGAGLFFNCMDVVEKGLSLLRTGGDKNNISTTHPPNSVRGELINKFLTDTIPKEEIEGPMQTSNTIGKITELLWEKSKPLFRKLHEEGKKPAKSWG